MVHTGVLLRAQGVCYHNTWTLYVSCEPLGVHVSSGERPFLPDKNVCETVPPSHKCTKVFFLMLRLFHSYEVQGLYFPNSKEKLKQVPLGKISQKPLRVP